MEHARHAATRWAHTHTPAPAPAPAHPHITAQHSIAPSSESYPSVGVSPHISACRFVNNVGERSLTLAAWCVCPSLWSTSGTRASLGGSFVTAASPDAVAASPLPPASASASASSLSPALSSSSGVVAVTCAGASVFVWSHGNIHFHASGCWRLLNNHKSGFVHTRAHTHTHTHTWLVVSFTLHGRAAQSPATSTPCRSNATHQHHTHTHTHIHSAWAWHKQPTANSHVRTSSECFAMRTSSLMHVSVPM